MSAEAVPTPKDRFSSLDTLALVHELRRLDRARLDKVFDLPGGLLSLVFRSASAGRQELVVGPGRFAALLAGGVERAEELSALSRELRRHLSGAVVTRVGDPAGERLLQLDLRRADVPEPLSLVVEFFGAGNVLLARGGRLIVVQHPRTWAHRSVRPGAEYAPPPRRDDPWTMTESQLAEVLAASRKDRASTLAARLAFGGPLAEELLCRAGLDPSAAAPERPADTAHALAVVRDELLRAVDGTPPGFVYEAESGAVDVEPFPSQRWKEVPGVAERSFPTFSEAVMAYFPRFAPAATPEPSAPDRRRAELEHLRGQQRAAVEALSVQASELRSAAEAVYAHYAEVEEALAAAERTHRPAAGRAVQIAERTIPLTGTSVVETAQALFEEAKRVEAKRSGAATALEATERSLLQVEERVAGEAAAAAARPAAAHKAQWFERHRWFISSEGFVVIGGRDARSNDLIVRRYLNAEDRYVHADIHGAPSVIVKHGAPGSPAPGAATMREAGQWGVAFSKAWRAGLASADAFWVAADQVSKQAASGEFVARGAWVIHGTKNPMRDLPVELGIGRIEMSGESRWSVAPPEALRARGELAYLLRPDDERDRSAREVELASALGIARALLQPMLPAGGLAFRRA